MVRPYHWKAWPWPLRSCFRIKTRAGSLPVPRWPNRASSRNNCTSQALFPLPNRKLSRSCLHWQKPKKMVSWNATGSPIWPHRPSIFARADTETRTVVARETTVQAPRIKRPSWAHYPTGGRYSAHRWRWLQSGDCLKSGCQCGERGQYWCRPEADRKNRPASPEHRGC